ncbi:small nuclear RNA activating complex, polypeptide 2, isoform CRA_a [Rattus norvegicus]|uniref:Small nuclear RNA activating complex, polypeptide 2, isoform CRA_a n=1 Tax=Rattus norvegicus TaxID=10116 RepID=A6KQ69_RAT|nr:small nuclear RNA activating complex, polypeptide 2, isoform CRA_a [Rattus norvegicus]
MKPPQRRRKVPARYTGEATGPTAWSPREMRHLLRLLQARRGQPEPDAKELAKELRGRSEAEICRFIQQLKGRVVREAIRKASGTNPETSGLVPEVSVPDPDAPTESLAGSSTERDFAVDFEKIYKYLSSSSRGGHGPELSAVESAVVLNLLMSLAEELPHLPCTALVDHLTKTYAQLTAPQASLDREKRPRPGTEDGGTDSTGPEETGQGSPQASEPTEPRLTWKAAGVCPLNPFLVPLDLLSQALAPAR